MKRNLLIFAIAVLFIINGASAQVHWTAADTLVNSFWVNNAASSSWKLTKCSSGDNSYALFSIDVSKFSDDTLKAGYWATDIKEADFNPNFAAEVEPAVDQLFVKIFAHSFS